MTLRDRKEIASPFGLFETKSNRGEHSSLPNEKRHSQIGKSDEKDRWDKVAASLNGEAISLRSLKAELRFVWKERRLSISTQRRKEAAEKLLTLPCEGYIASFSSFGSEIETHFLNARLMEEKRLILPKVVGDELHFFHVETPSQLELSPWGILEPISSCKSAEEISTVLVPGLSFDKNRFRLGYGKGHYDRFLSKTKTVSLGIGFQEQFTDSLPHELHDCSVDHLVLV
jgi:5-formyltetrahydrofolate cyclo-ligase